MSRHPAPGQPGFAEQDRAICSRARSGVLRTMCAGICCDGRRSGLPYALAPRLALSALSREQAGQGSGIVNASTFLGGIAGVAGGATASALGGFLAVLTMIALAGTIGAVLSRWSGETA